MPCYHPNPHTKKPAASWPPVDFFAGKPVQFGSDADLGLGGKAGLVLVPRSSS